jgi:hypothetical protein
MRLIETVPITGSDAEIAEVRRDLAEFYSGAQDAGLEPTVMLVESHSGGTTFVIDLDGSDHLPLDAA